MRTPVLSLVNICKSFGNNKILKNISLEIYKGEFVTLLGESGCGKTTTLRAVAGLETIDSGEIILDGVNVSSLHPDKRNVNTVFQNYALFPHMNVYDNIAYGPKIKGVSKHEIKKGVAEMLSLVKMEGYEKRMPSQLSGGQRQRVAIARALINRPLILLLDEPLGALDFKLRQHMQLELKSIQKQAGVTFIYVTHDQDEALNMSDRLAVMDNGMFSQIGTPKEIYEQPKTLFVAGFVGDRNILPVRVTGVDKAAGVCVLDLCGFRILAKNNDFVGDEANLAIHTDRIKICDGKPDGNFLKGVIEDVSYTGSKTKTTVSINNEFKFIAVEYNKSYRDVRQNQEEVFLSFDAADAVLV